MIVAITMVKDEVDIIEATVGRMIHQVDHVIVADNGSTDGTLDVLYDLGINFGIDVLEDRDPAYYQSRKMSALAAAALDAGATWIIPFDADEVWKCRRGSLRHALDSVDDSIRIVTADLYDHVPTAIDTPGISPVAAITWRRPHPAPLPKVACRAHETLTIHQGNHGASYADQPVPLSLGGLLNIRHFPLRSPEQMVRKARNGAAAYAATTGLPEGTGQHWIDWDKMDDRQIGEAFRTYYWSDDPEADGLINDPA